MRKLLGIHGTWLKLQQVLTLHQRRRYYALAWWGMLNTLLEIVGISVLLHAVLSILRPNFIQHNFFTRSLSQIFGITEQLPFVALICSLLLVLYLVKNIIIVRINKAQVRFAYDVTDQLLNDRYEAIAKRDLLYFKQRRSSEITNELFSTSIYLPERVIIPSIILLSELSVLMLTLAAILIYKPILFVFTLITVVPAAGFLIVWNRSKLDSSGRKVNQINPLIYDNIAQFTKGIENIKLWNGTRYFVEDYGNNKRKTFDLKSSIFVRSEFIPMRIYEVIAILGILCLVLFSLIYDKGNDSLITYISIYAAVAFRLLPSVNRILVSFNSLATNGYALDYFTNTDETMEENVEQVDSVEFRSSIELNKISFAYPEGERVLHDLDLTIHKGECIGIVGESGSGKSTLVNIIASLIPMEQGEILLDGERLSEEQIDAYRYLFAYVKQDVFMLNRSILENIAFLQDPEAVDHDKVWACLEHTNLSNWIKGLEHGIDTQVGELGNQISGGQRQRIAIARALYKDASIFIFDEVTNNLDVSSIKQTMGAIEDLKKSGKTLIMITHKADELKICDKVYQLNSKLHVTP